MGKQQNQEKVYKNTQSSRAAQNAINWNEKKKILEGSTFNIFIANNARQQREKVRKEKQKHVQITIII